VIFIKFKIDFSSIIFLVFYIYLLKLQKRNYYFRFKLGQLLDSMFANAIKTIIVHENFWFVKRKKRADILTG